jgi:hypothetical protein
MSSKLGRRRYEDEIESGFGNGKRKIIKRRKGKVYRRMDKLWVWIIVIAIVLVAAALLVIPNYDKLMNTGNNMMAKTNQLDQVLNDSSKTVGSSVRQYMSMAKAQGSGYLVDGTSSLVSSQSNGAVDFADSGAFQTGKLYVVVNYLASSTGTYTQTTNMQDVVDSATFTMSKKSDSTGRVTRMSFTQVSQGN